MNLGPGGTGVGLGLGVNLNLNLTSGGGGGSSGGTRHGRRRSALHPYVSAIPARGFIRWRCAGIDACVMFFFCISRSSTSHRQSVSGTRAVLSLSHVFFPRSRSTYSFPGGHAANADVLCCRLG